MSKYWDMEPSMRYRELLDETLLDEGRTFEVPSDYGDIRVWENPGEPALRVLKNKLGELRGLTFPDGNYWVWRAHDATHQAVRKPNQIDSEAHFYISGTQPQDEGWTLGTWGMPNQAGDMKMWIDRQNVPSRLKAAFPGPATFTKFETPH
jgi:hypothetical protein